MTENSKHNQPQILISCVYYIEGYDSSFDNVINVSQRSITWEHAANEISRHDGDGDGDRDGDRDGDGHLTLLPLGSSDILRVKGS